MKILNFNIIYQTFARDFYYLPEFICDCDGNEGDDMPLSSIYRWGFWNFWYNGYVREWRVSKKRTIHGEILKFLALRYIGGVSNGGDKMIDKQIYELLTSVDDAVHYLMETNDILRTNNTFNEISVLLESGGEGND